MNLRTTVVCSLFSSLAFATDPSLTLYNQHFAVVREIIPLALKQGVNQIQFTDTTAHLEPESVILRDPSGKQVLQILEQNYRADPVSVDALLGLYEGKTIEFQVRNGDRIEIIPGKIIRAGNAQRPGSPAYSFGPPYGPQQAPFSQAIIEIGGKLRFDLPGVPVFPALTGDTILKPALDWTIQTDRTGNVDAELAYVSGGFNWESDYNVVQGTGNALDLIGWVTMENRSGRAFQNARIKLMAGDVNKIQPQFRPSAGLGGGVVGGVISAPYQQQVTQKTFDEYHLYTLQRPVTLHDKESKQVEFVRADGIKSETLYVYDGLKLDPNRYMGAPAEAIRQDSGYGTQSNPKVWVMREFINSDGNHLGMPLPKGRVRFYRRDSDGRLEFTGEDTIDHTPKDEKIRLFTGAAFDLVGERRRTSYRIDHGRSTLDESFEIKLRNRKKEPAEVRVVEHLYRWNTWEIQASSMPSTKTESQTIEFKVQLQPDEEKTVTYAVRYTW